MASVLVIRVHEAEGLQDVAWFGMNQDPYVLVRALPSGVEVKTGSIWGGGTKPRWDPTKHSSHLVMRVSPGDHSLVFEVKNKNQMMTDELIGSAVMDMNIVIEDTAGNASPLPLTLQTGGGTLLATVFRQLSPDDADLAEALARSIGGGSVSTSGGNAARKHEKTGSRSGGGSGGGSCSAGGNTLGGSAAPQTAEERRAAVVAAAEARQGSWRQGGAAGADPAKQQALAERRQKDELIGRIEAAYNARGQVHPFSWLTAAND